MAQAKAINLRVRPLQSVDLCFEVDGVIGDQPDIHLLGKTVPLFDLPGFYATLGQTSSAGPGDSRLKFDSAAIRSQLAASILFELRAEPIKAELDKAVAQRQNTYLQKFNDPTVITTLQTAATDKAANLKSLIDTAKSQHGFLQTQYAADFTTAAGFPDGVVKVTHAETSNVSHPVSVTTTTSSSGSTANQTQDASKDLTGTSKTDTRNYDYRHPKLENDAQFYRSQVSLGDEALAQFLSSRNRNNLSTVFANDLAALDLDVRKLQVGYASTILVSPIAGVVTGVFRNKGDSVRAGQPVVRVENDEEIYLVGTIKYRGVVSLLANVSVTTLIFDSQQSKTIPGTVVAVRGHDSEDELWDVLIRCNNRDAGKPIFPINYNFDFDDTTVDFV